MIRHVEIPRCDTGFPQEKSDVSITKKASMEGTMMTENQNTHPLNIMIPSVSTGRILPHLGLGTQPASSIGSLVQKGLAHLSASWYTLMRLVYIRLQQHKITDIVGDREDLSRELLSQYVRIVAEHGFDSAAAAKFKAAHHDDTYFLRKATFHDRLAFRNFQEQEAKKKRHGPERSS